MTFSKYDPNSTQARARFAEVAVRAAEQEKSFPGHKAETRGKKGKAVIINGTPYPSIRIASAATGMSRVDIQQGMANGIYAIVR